MRHEGNPLHEEQLEIVAMLGGSLALNTVIDESRRLSFVTFGDVVASHMKAVEFVRGYAEVPVARRFHTVVTSAAGHPLDRTYYQTVKGMVAPLDILAPGGTLIVAAECSDGMGSREFLAAQRRLVELGPDAFLAGILGRSHAAVDEWQTQMQLKPMRLGRVQLFTALDPALHDATGVEIVASVSAAVAASVARHGDGAVAVIPEGPYVVPFYRPAARVVSAVMSD